MRRLLRTIDKYITFGDAGKRLNPNTYPNNLWYRKHLDRNYDMVFLGNADRIPKIQIPDDVKAFDWSLGGQNLIWDFNVLKHFFSILKPTGCVIFPLSDNFIEEIERNVDERKYYLPMMPYFFSQSKMKQTYIRICKRIPQLAIYPKMIGKKYSGGKNSDEAYYKADRLISQICDFLEERDVSPYFFLISEKAAGRIKALLPLFEGKQCHVKILSNGQEYNWETIQMVLDNGNK